eukprot:13263462-Alexandrium_andersonii.AAC.1
MAARCFSGTCMSSPLARERCLHDNRSENLSPPDAVVAQAWGVRLSKVKVAMSCPVVHHASWPAHSDVLCARQPVHSD